MKAKSLAIVTGASKGIGKAIAIELASHDYIIICISKSDQTGLINTVDTIKANGYDAYPILCDVSCYNSVKSMYDEISLLNLPITILINNAGISLVKLFIETTIEDWNQVINTNLTSLYNMCHFAVKDMLHNHYGHIINISSIWGNDGASMEVAYSTSKGGMNSFTKALAKELGPSNIKVNALACGVIDTGMNSFLTKEENDALKNSISLGRYGKAQEIADMTISLIEKGSYINGQVITIDGGMY